MPEASTSEALRREHREIDAALEFGAAAQTPGDAEVRALQQALARLRRHICIEETVIFPPLRAGHLVAAIFAMLRGHGGIWNAMAGIDAALAGDPQANLGEGCKRLLALLADHNKTEESVIYAELDRSLAKDVQDKVRELLEDGVLPDGWVCAKAAAAA